MSTQLPGDQVVLSGRLLPTALSIHPFSLVLKHKGKTRGSSIQNSKGSQRNDCNKRREKCYLSSAAFIPHSQVTDIQQDRERTEISWTKAVPGLENQPAHPQNCLGDRVTASGGSRCLSHRRRTVMALGSRRETGVCCGHCCCVALRSLWPALHVHPQLLWVLLQTLALVPFVYCLGRWS